jgi:predicted Rossmann fold flavoprotein
MLLAEMKQAGVVLRLSTLVTAVEKTESGFRISIGDELLECASLVVATGGKSIPKLGSDFGYRLATQFGLALTETRPGLVPLTFGPDVLARLSPLSGIGLPSRVSLGKMKFDEAMLFTHRGLSGPSILQISSYWREGAEIAVNLLPETDAFEFLREARKSNGRRQLAPFLSELLPQKLARSIVEELGFDAVLGDLSDEKLRKVAARLNDWRIKPSGSEGYRTAEVTLGGIDTAALDSKTMVAKAVPGLYFIGELVDVTGWLGGYNFQWAWSSGWVAGQTA